MLSIADFTAKFLGGKQPAQETPKQSTIEKSEKKRLFIVRLFFGLFVLKIILFVAFLFVL